MHFVLSRVTEEDLDEMLEVQFRAFSKVDVHLALFGPNTKEHRDLTKARFLKDMKEDAADCWMKLVDTSNGKIVSAAQWKIYPTWAPLPEHPPLVADWHPEGEERQWAEEMIQEFLEKRGARMYNHAHVCTCFNSYSFPESLLRGVITNLAGHSTLYPFHRPFLPEMRRRLHPREMGHGSRRSFTRPSVGRRLT
jgi:hypothetical protein